MQFIAAGKYAHIIKKYELGLPDELDCPSCDHPVYFQHSFLEIQSIVKNDKPAAINKIQFDYADFFSRANHIIAIGYSFPKDDIMNSVFLSNMKIRKDDIGKDCKLTFISYDQRYVDRGWLKLEDVEVNTNIELKQTKDVISKIFKPCNIRLNFAGFPDILHKVTVDEILHWL